MPTEERNLPKAKKPVNGRAGSWTEVLPLATVKHKQYPGILLKCSWNRLWVNSLIIPVKYILEQNIILWCGKTDIRSLFQLHCCHFESAAVWEEWTILEQLIFLLQEKVTTLWYFYIKLHFTTGDKLGKRQETAALRGLTQRAGCYVKIIPAQDTGQRGSYSSQLGTPDKGK